MKNFIVKLTLLTLAIALLGGLAFTLFIPEHYLHVFPALLLLFFIVTMLVHIYLRKFLNKKPGKFMSRSMLVTFLKLMLYSAIGIIYIMVDTQHAVSFVIGLMLLYLIYTFFAIKELSKIVHMPHH